MELKDWIGFVGVFILLLSFLLNLLNKIRQNSFPYIVMNLIGSSLACLASVMIHYMPFILLEGAWTIVSLCALILYVMKGPAEQELNSSGK